MDGLLPLLIALFVAAFISMSRKKKPNTAEEEPASPWSEAWKDLDFPSPPKQPEESTVSDPDDYSYEMEQYGSQESIPTEYTFEEPVSLETLIPDTSQITDSAIFANASHLEIARVVDPTQPIEATLPENEESTESENWLLNEDFDGRKAIIYSEVMNPRYTKL